VCTIASLIRGDKCFMLKNFDYRPVPTGWSLFEPFDDDIAHFALVDHAQQGVNSGLNSVGLGLQISRSKCGDPTPERLESRTVLNAEVLSRFNDVTKAVSHIENYASENPTMFGGNVMLADRSRISITEYFNGRSHSEILKEGFLSRANHSIFGLIDNEVENSLTRHGVMTTFADNLYQELPALSDEEIVSRCQKRLRTRPLLTENTRSSLVMDIPNKRVHYMVGAGPWKKFEFTCETVLA
jgi:hypothetical protein